MASTFGKLKMVEFLLDHGASIDLVNSRGESALSKATERGHTEVASLLQQCGANCETIIPVSTPGEPIPTLSLFEQPVPELFAKPELSIALRELLPLSSEWENIGLLLEVPDKVVCLIKRYHPSKHLRIQEVLCTWLEQKNPEEATWKRLIDTVDLIDPYVAHRILRQIKINNDC